MIEINRKLSIITPVSRPLNLLKIQPFIPIGAEWILVSDGQMKLPKLHIAHSFFSTKKTSDYGNTQRLMGIKEATREYIYFLDDDNIIYPLLPSLLLPYMKTNEIDAIIFGLLSHYFGKVDIWFPPNVIIPQSVDTGMLFVKRSTLLSLCFGNHVGWPNYRESPKLSDYILIRELHTKFNLRKIFGVLGFHNALDLFNIKQLDHLAENEGNIDELIHSFLTDQFFPTWLQNR